MGKAIRVRVAFADDGGNEETLTSAPTVVTAAGLQLQSATVDGVTLTLTYSEELDNGGTLGTTPFAVRVNGSPRSLSGVAVGGSNVLLLLSSAVEAGDTVTVDYTAPDGPDFIRDIQGRKAASFSGQAVTNDTASARTSRLGEPQDGSTRLTASVSGEPSSHDGQTAFTFELQFSEDPKPGFSYRTVLDHAFTVTGGSVTHVRQLEAGKNVRWEITVVLRLQRRRGYRPERHHRLLRQGRHLHGGRGEAVRWASAGRSGAEHPGDGRSHHHRRRPRWARPSQPTPPA